MSSRIHPQARTTPKIRQEIKDSGLSDREAAEVFNISRATAAKWLKRDDVQERSHRAHTLHTTLGATQEAVVLSLRQSLYLPLDDLLCITREYINPAVSRAGLGRLLKREGMSRLEDIIPQADGETINPKKTFKDYEPGNVHVDIKYLPQMPDESSRCYLFVAIDRATRWVFLHIYRDMSEASSVDFLRRLNAASPIKISKILTDNGSQFTDRFAAKDKKSSGQHAFDVACSHAGIEHRLAPPRHPQTNGMVERFNGRIAELLKQTRFDSRADLETTLLNYLKCTTTTFRNAPSTEKLRFKRSRNGRNDVLNYSSNAFMNRRDFTARVNQRTGAELATLNAFIDQDRKDVALLLRNRGPALH